MQDEITKMLTTVLDSWVTEQMLDMSTEQQPAGLRTRRIDIRCFGGSWTMALFEDAAKHRWPSPYWTFTHSSFEWDQDGLISGDLFAAVRHFIKEGFVRPAEIAFACGGMPVRMWLTPPIAIG